MTSIDPNEQDLSILEAHLAALHEQLVQAAVNSDLLDVAYRTIDTPIGALLLAATGQGLVRIAFEREDFDSVLAALAAKVSPRILIAPHRLDQAAWELDQYFAGTRRDFDLQLDRRLSTGFRRAVQEYLPSVGYGQTTTYRQIAEQVGSPRAVRAVGSACATNPLPIVVPCHRVVRSDGGLGGYLGGLQAKFALQELESASGKLDSRSPWAPRVDQGGAHQGNVLGF